MKQLLFLLIFPCLALAQYPNNGNQKITLGEQTTADGLVFRGVANDTTRKPSVDTMAYIILDTATNIQWHYKKAVSNAWLRVGGSISSGLTGVLPVENGGTGASVKIFVDTINTQIINGKKTFTDTVIVNKGIRFPATQSASTNVNTLDDYEEGTWSPVFAGNDGASGQTYAYQKGNYVKVGKIVTCYFEVKVTTIGTLSGLYAVISGLPFTISSTPAYLDGGSILISFFDQLATSQVVLSGYALNGESRIWITAASTAVTNYNNISPTNAWKNNTRVAGMITYISN